MRQILCIFLLSLGYQLASAVDARISFSYNYTFSKEMKLSLKSILIAFIGSNLIFLVFTYSVQLKILFFLHYADRFNIILSISLGFIIIAFIFMIYMYHGVFLCNSSIKMSKSKVNKAMLKTQKQQKQENYTLTFLIHSKCIADGFIHGYFLQQNQLQYILLIVVKLGLLVNISINRKLLKRKKYYLSLMYYFMGIGIDSLCFCSRLGWISGAMLSQIWNEYSYMKCVQLALVGWSVLLVAIYVLVQSYYEIRQSFFKGVTVKNLVIEARPESKVLTISNKIAPQFLSTDSAQMNDYSIKPEQKDFKFRRIRFLANQNTIIMTRKQSNVQGGQQIGKISKDKQFGSVIQIQSLMRNQQSESKEQKVIKMRGIRFELKRKLQIQKS